MRPTRVSPLFPPGGAGARLIIDDAFISLEYGRKRSTGAGIASGHSDWQCDRCNAVNFARRARCYQCYEERPARVNSVPGRLGSSPFFVSRCADAAVLSSSRGGALRHPRIVGEGMGTSLLTPAPVRGDVDGRYDCKEARAWRPPSFLASSLPSSDGGRRHRPRLGPTRRP